MTPATVVDHIKPHKGDQELFWDENNLQSLCKSCHDAVKKKIELHGFSDDIGEDGYPVDPDHPMNAHGEKKYKPRFYKRRMP